MTYLIENKLKTKNAYVNSQTALLEFLTWASLNFQIMLSSFLPLHAISKLETSPYH